MESRRGLLLQIVRLGRCKQWLLVQVPAFSHVHKAWFLKGLSTKNVSTAMTNTDSKVQMSRWDDDCVHFSLAWTVLRKSSTTPKIMGRSICLLAQSAFYTLSGILVNQVTRFEGHVHDLHSRRSQMLQSCFPTITSWICLQTKANVRQIATSGYIIIICSVGTVDFINPRG